MRSRRARSRRCPCRERSRPGSARSRGRAPPATPRGRSPTSREVGARRARPLRPTAPPERSPHLESSGAWDRARRGGRAVEGTETRREQGLSRVSAEYHALSFSRERKAGAMLSRNARRHHRSGPRQPARPRNPRDPQDVGRGHGATHARVGARRPGASRFCAQRRRLHLRLRRRRAARSLPRAHATCATPAGSRTTSCTR